MSALIQDLREAAWALTLRPPTRFEIMINVVFWFVLVTGNVARAPKGFYPEAQADAVAAFVIDR